MPIKPRDVWLLPSYVEPGTQKFKEDEVVGWNAPESLGTFIKVAGPIRDRRYADRLPSFSLATTRC